MLLSVYGKVLLIPALFISEAWQRHHLNQTRGSAIVGYTRDALGKVGQNVTRVWRLDQLHGAPWQIID